MRFAFVLALTLLTWFSEGRRTRASVLALCVCTLAGFVLSRSKSERWRALAPLAPALFLFWRTLAYAAHPERMRAAYSAVLLGIAGVAAQLALAPLVRSFGMRRAVGGLCLTFTLYCFAFAGAEAIYSRTQPVDPYRFEPAKGSTIRSTYLQDKRLEITFRRGFRGRFTHPEYGGEQVEINNCGFRGRDWPEQPEPGTAGILLLGDSSLFGFGVALEDTIAARLEGQLAARHPGRKFRVYNAGVPSYGPRHELVVLRLLADRLQPRVCIVCFQDANDLEDCHRQFVATREAGFHSERLRSEDLEKTGQFRAPDLFASPVAAQVSPLWSRTYWSKYSSLFRDIEFKLTSRLADIGIAPVRFVYNPGFLRAMAREPDLAIQDELGLAVSALREIDEECGRRGIAFAVVRFPGVLQCEPSTLKKALLDLGLDPESFDRRQPGASVVADAQSRGVPARDLLPFLEVPEGESCPYFFREGHPNRDGDERIAQELLTLLEGDEKLAAAIGRDR